MGRVVSCFHKQGEEFQQEKDETRQAEDGMEKGKLGHTFKAKCTLGMKRGRGRIRVLPHENKGTKGPCLSTCLLDSLHISLRKPASDSLHLFSLTGNKIQWIPLPPRASKVLSPPDWEGSVALTSPQTEAGGEGEEEEGKGGLHPSTAPYLFSGVGT